MTPEEYNQRLRQTMARIVEQNPFINAMFGKCGSAEVFVHELAEQQISDWARGVLHGKPPWHKGRWKTRGGRDQDRWRKGYPRVKQSRQALIAAKNSRAMMLGWARMEDYCQANKIEFRRFAPFDFCDTSGAWPVAKVTVDGVDECGVAVQMADELQCECDSFNGTLTLKDNPDCDFVNGGELPPEYESH